MKRIAAILTSLVLVFGNGNAFCHRSLNLCSINAVKSLVLYRQCFCCHSRYCRSLQGKKSAECQCCQALSCIYLTM